MVDRFTARLFGRHVGDRAHGHPFLGQQGASRQPGQAEIHDLRLAALRDHDVGALDVPVSDPLLVRFSQAFGDLNPEAQGFFDLQKAPFDFCLQAFALDEGH